MAAMRCIIQRVSSASVTVEGVRVAEIGPGLLLLLGIEQSDTAAEIPWLSAKILNLRIFSDDQGAMNRSVLDERGEIIVVSQFTLHASTKIGNRPSFVRAARPEQAIPLYEAFVGALSEGLGKAVGTGVFGAHMEVELLNDGPVSIIIDSQQRE